MSIQFKSNLPPIPSRSTVVEDGHIGEEFRSLEVGAAGVVDNLLKENLLLDAKDLCLSILPFVSQHSDEQLKRTLICKLGYCSSR